MEKRDHYELEVSVDPRRPMNYGECHLKCVPLDEVLFGLSVRYDGFDRSVSDAVSWLSQEKTSINEDNVE